MGFLKKNCTEKKVNYIIRNEAGKRTFQQIQYSKATLRTVRTHEREQTTFPARTGFLK